MENNLTKEQALRALFNAAQQARLTAQEHETVKKAAQVLQNHLQEDDKDDKGKDKKIKNR
jgi:rhamnogalacturonyl hydrolase YesR